jgi:hypothetical protein
MAVVEQIVRVPKRATNTVDLRQSIEKRLMAFRLERRRLQARTNLLLEMEKEYEQLLAEADQASFPIKVGDRVVRKPSDALTPSEEDAEESPNAKLKEFLLTQVARESCALNDLVGLALSHGFNFGTKSPARVMHFNLLNLKNAGLIEKEGDKWKSIRNQPA